MKQDALILVRGGGDLATGTIHSSVVRRGCGCLYWKPLTGGYPAAGVALRSCVRR